MRHRLVLLPFASTSLTYLAYYGNVCRADTSPIAARNPAVYGNFSIFVLRQMSKPPLVLPDRFLSS